MMNLDKEMPSLFKKMPLLLKIIIGSVPILIAIFYSYYSTYSVVKNKQAFYKQRFSSVVTKSNAPEGRTTEFHLENSLKIYFWLSAKNTITIGDCIKKYYNAYLYYAYRKDNNGSYELFATYDFEKMR